MHRVFFDVNEGNQCGYKLNLPHSIIDISSIDDGIKDGMRIIIYMPDELEMEAIAKYSENYNCWIAIPILSTLKHVST